MSKREKINFIKRIVEEIGEVSLSSRCGDYFRLGYNGQNVLAFRFVGKYGYDTARVENLSEKNISAIYDDMIVDFS